jgi:hypothetical protein
MTDLKGKKYEFDDGMILSVVDVKQREDGLWVTYESGHPSAIPRRFVTQIGKFLETFGHLFGVDNGKI